MISKKRLSSHGLWPVSVRQAGGFTLIEMMATLVLMGIFAQLVGSLTGWQLKQYTKMTQQLKIEDSARGAINILRDDAHQAGFGFAKTADSAGGLFVGNCDPTNYNDTNGFSDLSCTQRDEDGLSDRLRFMYGDPQKNSYINSATTSSQGPCIGGTETGDYNSLMLNTNDVFTPLKTFIPFQNCYVIGGLCEDGSTNGAASAVMCLATKGSNTAINSKGCGYVLTVYREGRYFSSAGCSQGWKPGYSLSYLDQGHYALNAGQAPNSWDLYRRQRNETPAIVAKNVSQFTVTYGIDLSNPMDGKLDACPSCTDDPTPSLFDTKLSWCRDLGSRCGMTLSDGSALTADNIYSRIIAVHVSFVIYNKTPADGSTYRATFSLQNRLSK